MNKVIASIVLVHLSFAGFFSLNAQYTDSTKTILPLKDSLPRPGINWNTAPVKRIFPYKSYLLPATMVVYGIVSLHTDALQDINESIKEEVYTDLSPRKTHIDNYLQYSPALAVYALNAVGIHGADNFRDRTVLLGMSALFMGIGVNVGKKITGETRPDGSDNLSFPSGHTATAFAAAEFLRQEYKNISPLYGIAGYAAAAATGYLRISNNKHWAGDVVAGAGVGIISTKLAYWIYPAIKRKLFKDRKVTTIVMPIYENGSIGFGLAHYF